MKVKTTRFGDWEINDQTDIIYFAEGILGFEKLHKFVIIDPGDKTLIVWLQSLDNPSVAFPMIEPAFFNLDYKVNLLEHDLQALELENLLGTQIYTILTIPQDVTLMSANMKAPVVINTELKKGRQVVLQDNKPSVRFEMYKELKKYLVAYESDDSRRTRIKDPATNPVPHAPEQSPVDPLDAPKELDVDLDTATEDRPVHPVTPTTISH